MCILRCRKELAVVAALYCSWCACTAVSVCMYCIETEYMHGLIAAHDLLYYSSEDSESCSLHLYKKHVCRPVYVASNLITYLLTSEALPTNNKTHYYHAHVQCFDYNMITICLEWDTSSVA